ncbi:hypothetical protein TRFO_33313 [Tritrichomonas foetus]|uniref:Uncharacterized protein n=1 Tax=Tritrichomonas foetus TaxID=1144522 RepID=A0A1J4JRD4_9EUKA|nr:hypothetical protein TRFO_33313 [Tritrichomonas foetus]|eukprot:OHT00076.1 hypothetical protein TRFO_33313 [Tritrichomonas foetus]
MTATEKYYQAVPMNASGSLGMIDQLLEEIIKCKTLQTNNITNTDNILPNDQNTGNTNISETERDLLDICSRLNSNLCDIIVHINLLELKKVENNGDFDALSSFKRDVDHIQQKLINIGMDIAEFHRKHDDTIKRKRTDITQNERDRHREIVVKAHKMWLIYNINFLKSSIESVRRLYRLITTAK